MTAILIVDDNEADRAQIKKILSMELGSLIFYDASTKEEFISQIENRIDMIICDNNLFDLDVFEILRTASEQEAEISVMIYTGIGSEELSVETLKKGADDYLIKSSTHLRELAERVDKVLKRSTGILHTTQAMWEERPSIETEDGALEELVEKVIPLHREMLDDAQNLEEMLKEESLDTSTLQRMIEMITRSLSLLERAQIRKDP